jgi:hypothetical protein
MSLRAARQEEASGVRKILPSAAAGPLILSIKIKEFGYGRVARPLQGMGS